jgi:hypothetical protein
LFYLYQRLLLFLIPPYVFYAECFVKRILSRVIGVVLGKQSEREGVVVD